MEQERKPCPLVSAVSRLKPNTAAIPCALTAEIKDSCGFTGRKASRKYRKRLYSVSIIKTLRRQYSKPVGKKQERKPPKPEKEESFQAADPFSSGQRKKAAKRRSPGRRKTIASFCFIAPRSGPSRKFQAPSRNPYPQHNGPSPRSPTPVAPNAFDTGGPGAISPPLRPIGARTQYLLENGGAVPASTIGCPDRGFSAKPSAAMSGCLPYHSSGAGIPMAQGMQKFPFLLPLSYQAQRGDRMGLSPGSGAPAA